MRQFVDPLAPGAPVARVARQPAITGRTSAGATVGRVADGLTVFGFLLVPIFVPNIGGPYGIVAADVVLGLAGLARGLHVMTVGVSLPAVRRHSYLLGVLGIFAVSGVFACYANGESPMSWPFLRIAIVTIGSVLLVATFGGDDWAHNRLRLMRAFSIGCTILAFSTLQGPGLQGRPIGWSIHPNSMGHSCVMGFFVAIWLWDNAARRPERWVWAGSAVAALYAVMQSGSRGGLVGLWAGGMIYLALRGSRKAIVGSVALTWVAVMLLAFGAVTLPASNPIARLFGDEASAGASDEARRDLLSEDLEVIGEDPVFGGGFADEDRIIDVHVVYLQGWIAAGAGAGFSLMLIGLTALALPFVTKRRDLALTCGAAAIVVAWLFTNILTLRDQWLFIAVAFGSAQSISVLRRERPEEALGSEVQRVP